MVDTFCDRLNKILPWGHVAVDATPQTKVRSSRTFSSVRLSALCQDPHGCKIGKCLVEVDIPETLADIIQLSCLIFMGA